MDGFSPAPTPLTWPRLLAIAASAFAIQIPFFFRGIPSGHDIEFHLYSWLEVLSQWKHGTIYPRWAALAHFGYGEPRFIFYPPASWTLGAILAAIFPWVLAPCVYIWLALVAAGISMFLLARHWLSARDATFAAVFYTVTPYHLLVVYWRSAFAELLASCLLPLLLLLLLRPANDGRRTLAPLALLLAISWLINAPAALMVHYSMALIALIVAWHRRSPRLLLTTAIAVVLGLCLSAGYLVPAIYEQKWVAIAQAVSEGSRPADNFLFAHTSDPEHDVFNRVISCVAVAEILATLAAGWAAWQWRKRVPTLWNSLAVWALGCAALMFSITNSLWLLLPKLQFMQFPWRWLLCLDVPLTLFVAAGYRKWTARAAMYLAMIAVIAFAWMHYLPPWWDTAADLREMRENVASGAGYEGTDEYAPSAADPSSLDKQARRVTVEGPARAAIHVFEWEAEHKVFTAEVSAADHLVLRLFNYPAWRVEVNEKVVEVATKDNTGQMLVPVTTGANRVRIDYRRTWDRKLGTWISAGGLLFLLALWWRSANRLNVAGAA